MGIWDFWTTEAKEYVHGQLDESQCSSNFALQPVTPDKGYVEIVLRRMKILKVRIGTKKFYGAVHSDLGLYHSSGHDVGFKSLITPDELKGKDEDATRLDRVIISNQRLLGPSPYRGGALRLNLALLSVKSVDLAGPFLEVLSGLSSAAGVSYIAVAQPFLKPLAAGIDLLTGTAGAAVREIQVVTNLDPLKTGVYVVLRASRDELDFKDIRVNEEYTLTFADGQPITDYPYMVISIESSQTRNDWKGIPDIKKAFDAVADAVKNDKPKEYEEALAAFRRTVLLSDDLLLDHARELFKQVKETMDDVMGATLTTRSAFTREIPTLDAFNPFNQ
jgi:hypothetical protein